LELFFLALHSLQSINLTCDRELTLPNTNIQELTESVQNLVKSNASAYQQQKLFTENASHELQAPIAITLGETFGDHIIMTLNYGYAMSLVIATLAFGLVLIIQLSASQCISLAYWSVIIATTIGY
jgi:signal transduction histidine kinase